MTLKQIQKEHAAWSFQNFGSHDAWVPMLGVTEEVGELAHAILKSAQNIRTGEDHVANAKDAIGDTVIYLMDLCTTLGFDLQDIVEETWYEVKQRDWKVNPATGS